MRVTSFTAFGGLLLGACAQGETLDGFGGSDFTSGSGGNAGTSTGKATGSGANTSTNAVVSSSATSTKSASASNTATATTNTTNTVASTTAAPAASTTVVTTGGTMACFDVCTAGAAPDPLACFGDPNALACIAGICVADPDCCDVAWDDGCALAGTFAAVTGACSC